MDEFENRCANLKRMLQKLNPDVDIERALRTMATSSESNESSPEVQWRSDPGRENAPSADKFEWNESPPSQTDDLDGMASLPTRSTGSGYLGNTTRAVT